MQVKCDDQEVIKMAKSGANPEAMDKMIQTLMKFIEVQDSVVETLNSNYQDVGDEWDDKKYEELGDVISQATTAIKGSYTTLSSSITKIQLLKSIMEDYLSQHMS